MKTKLIAIALFALAPFAASADDLSYNYGELSYQAGGSIDDGSASVDTDGFLVKASFEVNDMWFVSFDYASLSSDPSGADISDYVLAAGYRWDALFAKIGYESIDVGDFSDSGYNLDFGARGMVGDGFELNGHVGYSDLGDFNTFTNYGVGAVYSFGENMGVTFNYDMRSGDADLSSYGFGFRMNFN